MDTPASVNSLLFKKSFLDLFEKALWRFSNLFAKQEFRHHKDSVLCLKERQFTMISSVGGFCTQ